ncbi:MAG TPA: CRISPR-associated endonuclease Cas1 [Pseudonocardiaceae bacterium]
MTATEPLPISLVAHQVFCPRRAWLEAAGESTDTQQVAVGVAAHVPTDDTATSRLRRLRGVEITSGEWGTIGRCDTLEVDDDGALTVVEYKSAPRRRRADVTDPMRVQLTLQVHALREMGFRVAGQAVYFTTSRERVPVELTADDTAAAHKAVLDTRATLSSATAPEPLEDDPRCSGCSHIGVCLPDERSLTSVTRRIVVADPDTQVLHLSTPGSRASTRRGRVEVARQGESLASVPLERVQALVVHGNVDVSGALIRELLWRRLTVVWCSSNGRVVGWAAAAAGPNGAARPRQRLASAVCQLELAREFVSSKIANQATMLRRHGDAPDAIPRLRALQRQARSGSSVAALFGIEGDAAAIYFRSFATMFTRKVRDTIDFATRTRRPARDPVNAALNFSYGLLVGDVLRAVVACGLDPHAGFLHSSERNKPALVLDLCEEFRAPVADSVVLGAFNNGELKTSSFSDVLGVVNLRETGRRTLISAFERRVETTFRHPLFGYSLTWRRAMEVQARLVLGVIDGTQDSYVGVRTR